MRILATGLVLIFVVTGVTILEVIHLAEKELWLEKEEIYAQELKDTQDLVSLVFGKDWQNSRLMSENVKVTAYQSKVAQTDNTPHLTASGKAVLTGRIAVSRDLKIPFGTVVYLNGYGSFIVWDRMGPRATKQVDIWTGQDWQSIKLHGVQQTTMLWLEEKK